jgi:hypothetical protein
MFTFLIKLMWERSIGANYFVEFCFANDHRICLFTTHFKELLNAELKKTCSEKQMSLFDF